MPILPLLVFALSTALPQSRAPLPAFAGLESICTDTLQDKSVEDLLALGRRHLLDGKLGDALRAFQEAEAKDGASLRTHVFVLRVMISQDQIEDVLAEADALKQAGKAGIELDYLYGTGFYALAARDMASGKTTAVTGSQFEDAIQILKRVTEKNDPRFEDAWTTLAESAWYAQDFETGERAAKKSVELAPADPARRLLRGKLALAAYALWQADEEKAAAAEDQWQAAVEAFEKALALCGDDPDAKSRALAQQAWMQLATTYLWKQQRPDASHAFSSAVALDPDTADYGAINAALPGQEFVDTLEIAHKKWTGKHTTSDSPTLLWWIGYANYGIKKLPEAARAFESALAKNPEFASTLYYLYRVEYDQREFEKSLAMLHKYSALDAAGLVSALAFDVAGNSARLEFFIGWCLDEAKHAGKSLRTDAIFTCELITKIVPREADYSRHWNNLGLFLRDEGDDLRGTQGALVPAPKPYDEAKVNKLWEDALAAYEVSLELEPKNPNYLNDTAVMLHYYLLRDLERAKLMYQQGFVEATALLKRTDLSVETRDAVQIALRDTGNNVKLVQQLIDKRAAEAAGTKGDKPVQK